MPNVSEVADEAGLAKGTVYLYFPTKEDMLLELHQRRLVTHFFTQLMKALSRPGHVTFDDVFRRGARPSHPGAGLPRALQPLLRA